MIRTQGTQLIHPESEVFLVSLFTELRKNLQTGGPEKNSEEIAIFDVLLDGLDQGAFPDNEKLRAYVTNLAEATDRENEYEHVMLEHRALRELVDALTCEDQGPDRELD